MSIAPTCEHWRPGSLEEVCGAPAAWRTWVNWAEASFLVCDAHKAEIEQHDQDNEPDVEARGRFEVIDG